MIDLHCHILPGIDDGPSTLDDALDLARVAVKRGIHHAVVTPHIQPGAWDNDRLIITRTFDLFSDALLRAGIPLKLGMAAEVRVCPEVMPMLIEDELPFLGEWNGQRVMLLELPHEGIAPETEDIVRWIMGLDILPMIAHPERNKAILRDFKKIEPFVEMGCLFQITAGSLSGQFGEPAQSRALSIVEQGWATIVASDAHNQNYRPPNLDDGKAKLIRHFGDVRAQMLVCDTPRRLLKLT